METNNLPATNGTAEHADYPTIIAGLQEQVRVMVVKDVDSRAFADEVGSRIVTVRDQWKAQRKTEFAAKYEAQEKEIDTFKSKTKEAVDGLEAARKALSLKCSTWEAEQKRQAAIAEEARQAEVRRLEKERKAAAQKAFDEAILAEQKARLEHGEAAEANGNGNGVSKILDTPTAVVLPLAPAEVAYVAPQTAPKFANSHGTERWTYKVKDLRALCLAVGQGKESLDLLFSKKEQEDFRSSGLKELVDKTHVEAPAPGVYAFPEQTTTFKAKK